MSPCNPTRGLRSGPHHAGVWVGVMEGSSWALLWGSFLFQHFGRLPFLVKSSSPWPRRGHRGVWSTEEGLVKLGFQPAGVNKVQPCYSLLSPFWVELGA